MPKVPSGAGAILLTGALLSACVARPHLAPLEPREYTGVLVAAREATLAGRYQEADRLLSQFSARYPGTNEATEVLYWRSLLQMDPANREGSMTTGIAELDQYLQGSTSLRHYAEAAMLRRLAAQYVTAARLAAASVTTPTAGRTAIGDDRARDDEIQHLKDQLLKANEELDRIKRRLTTPTRP